MSAVVEVVDPGVVRIGLPRPASNAYLVLGRRVVLVDCGLASTAGVLVEALAGLGVTPSDISLVVLTHEHHDHVEGVAAFPDALVAAHPLAAAKLRHGDRTTTSVRAARHPELGLAHGSTVDAGGFSFRVLHTPGHSSGSLCLYERTRRILVTGDTAFARGTLSLVSASGSRGDHLESLERLAGLPARVMLPGHGHISEDPRGDLLAAAQTARDDLLDDLGEAA